MSVRRMLPFLLINVVVSAVVVLLILYWWEGRNGEDAQAVGAQTAVSAPILDQPQTENVQIVTAPTETVEATEAPPLHVVQAGDTLGSISQFYGVSMEDIMTANGLANPDVITVGQQLVIPINGLDTPEPEATETAVPDQLPSPIPTEPLPTGDVVIEISQVIGVGDLTEEAVQIRNIGANPTALLDWKLADQNGNFYTFGQITLFGEGAGILVHTEAGPNGATELFWGLSEAVWEPGELVTLLNAQDNIVATFAIP